MKKEIGIVLMILNLLFLAFNMICFRQTSRNVEAINKMNPIVCEPEPSDTEPDCLSLSMHLPSGSILDVEFSKSGVKIVRSDQCQDEKDCFYIIYMIRYQTQSSGYTFRPSVTDLYGELRLHQMLYRIGYRPDRTGDADLEYAGDSRWYVRATGRVIGWMGI